VRARPAGDDVIALARAVCLAVLVEPGLLRRARLRLTRDVGVAVESDLHFSPLVTTRNRTAIVLDPDVLAELRGTLAADSEYAGRARRLVAAEHAQHPAAIRLEEEVVWETVRHGPQGPPPEKLEARLRPAVKAMAEDADGGRRVARWAAQAWSRLPDSVTEVEAARLLALGASLRVGQASAVAQLADDRLPPSLSWLVPSEAVSNPIRLGLELADGGLRFVEPTPDALVVELPRTSPVVVEVSWDGESRLLSVEEGTEVPGATGEITLRTLAGRRYVIEPEIAPGEGAASLSGEGQQGEHTASEARLGEAIERLEAVLQEHRANRSGKPEADEVGLAEELGDLYGTLGGTLREQGEHLKAAVAYDAGYSYESDARYRLPSTHNALSRLIARIFLEPGALRDPGVLAAYEALPFVDVPQELEALRTRLEREVAGPRADDHWAAGDLALVSALTGDTDQLHSALAHFTGLAPSPEALSAYMGVAAGLAALDTQRQALLEELSARIAAGEGQRVAWDRAESPNQLTEAVRALDHHKVDQLCAALIRHLHDDQAPYPLDSARDILMDLRRQGYFVPLRQVADAFIQSGLDDPVIRRQYAQALIDEGNPSVAVPILNRLVADTTGAGEENVLARGVLGRAYKQMYVTAGPEAGERRRFLELAIDSYLSVYRESAAYRWHGINAVALLVCAERDGVELSEVDDPGATARDLAREILDAIEDLGVPDPWDQATAVEAAIALGDTDRALARLDAYLASGPDPFQIASTMRQLTEVWELDPSTDPGAHLIPVLKAELLRSEGGAEGEANADVVVGPSDLESATLNSAEQDPGFEKVLGTERFESLVWFRAAIDRCRAIARIEDPLEEPFGTGFLVDGASIHPSFPAVVLITNAHVVSETHARALRPDEARVTFSGLEDATVPYRITRLLWTSPPSELDATIVELDRYPEAATRCPVANQKPRLGTKPPPRIYVIGHPSGEAKVTLSVRDNIVVDGDDVRLHYRAHTEPGSSGSPVFDQAWELIALHHAAQQQMRMLHGIQGAYLANEGIWIERIKQQIAADGRPTMHDVFVSYSPEDRTLADSTCRSLEAAGLECWMAPRDIPLGSTWAEAIVDALDSSRLLVLVFSASANDSSHVMREVERAFARELPILLFRVEDSEPTGPMGYFLSPFRWLDAFGEPMDVHLAELVDAVQRVAGAEGLEHPVNAERSAENEAVLRDAADADDAAAATTLGLLARERGDLDEALSWLTKGAEGGDVMAATNLGLMARGRGDPDEALRWFTKGAEGGDVMAATSLGLLAKERGDLDEALRWLTTGAEGGDVMAATSLGLLAKARGDQDQARVWLTRGAQGGDPLAQEALGRMN
jgi:TIR domain/Trypsin-like peptidase domain